MAEVIDIKGYEEFKSSVKSIGDKKQIIVYFTGSKDKNDSSWCSDCNSAAPYIKSAITNFTKEGRVFVLVDVGDKSSWKDMKNPFRTDKDIHIQVIPTLIEWKGHKRLEGGSQCKNDDLLKMFFSDE